MPARLISEESAISRVIKHTDKEVLPPHVHDYTPGEATVYTDEWRAYERIARKHRTVKHGT